MSNLQYIFNLSLSLCFVVLAGFISIPALRRLVRNIHLTRIGKIIAGHYLNPVRASFVLPTGQRIEFVTWRKRAASDNQVEILYDPQRPTQAEVRNANILWFRPIARISDGLGFLVTACTLILGLNYLLAGLLGALCAFCIWFFVCIILILPLLLSMKFPIFRPFAAHIVAGFKSSKKRTHTRNNNPAKEKKS